MTSVYYLVSGICVFAMWLIIAVPTACYTGYQLKTKWNEQWLIKRRKTIIVIMFFMLCYLTLIDLPLVVIASFIGIASDTLFWVIIGTASFICRLILFTLGAMRIWLLYYDHQYGNVLSTKKWQILINPSIEDNWFLTQKHKYGNHKWLIKHIIPFLILYLVIHICCTVLDFHAIAVIWGISSTFVISAAIFCAIIWSRYPKINDIFLIRQEIKLLLKLGIVVLLILVITFSLEIILTSSTLSFTFAELEILYSMYLYVIIIYPQRTEIEKRRLSIQPVPNDMHVSWQQIVQTKDGYEAFANFLEKEFSIENILFVTEYIQLKQTMKKHEQVCNRINDIKENLKFDMGLPQSIPLSIIAKQFDEAINDNNIENTFIDSASKIFSKYIDSSEALLEVNISFKTRMKLMIAFKSTSYDKSIKNILPLLEAAVTEIAHLMNDSESRFKRESVYNDIVVNRKSVHSISECK